MADRTLLDVTQKTCTKCRNIKPLNYFYADPRCKRDGKQARCKECQRQYLYAHRKTPAGQATQRKYNLKYYYGLTPLEYEEMLKEQNGVCAICKKKPRNVRLAVDHCHKTNKVRGLLCRVCNTSLGQIQEELSWLVSAEDYLRKYNVG